MSRTIPLRASRPVLMHLLAQRWLLVWPDLESALRGAREYADRSVGLMVTPAELAMLRGDVVDWLRSQDVTGDGNQGQLRAARAWAAQIRPLMGEKAS